ncbi:MAG: hypothetical protein LUG51_06885 [Tannerellaceae bacterium]|nr:hypothetical protein [Tannerellaceae bacterium]
MAIIRSNDSPDAKEKQLRATPATWNTLVKEYFPLLRRVDYQIEYTQKVTN